ncbi:sodium-dependent glucose transporter 1-like isoform X2 [Watersipora subatra]
MRGAGHAFGGVIGGLTVDRWIRNIDLLCFFILLLYTAVSVSAAYVRSIQLLFVVFFLQGSIETWLQTAGYRIALVLWREKSAGPLYALHMGYGIGSIIAPQLVAPFLDARFSGGVIETGFNSSCRVAPTTPSISNNVTTTAFQESITPKYPANFVNAYWILSAISFSIALVFFVYFVHTQITGIRIGNDEKEKLIKTADHTFKKFFSARSCSPNHPTYAALIILLLFFYYVVSVPLGRAFSKFIFSYARDGPCLSVEASTSLESAYFAALTVGRLCAFLTSSVMHIKYILQVEVIGVLASTLVLFFLRDNITILWIFCSALGFFTGPIIPSAFAWANRYIEVTSTAQIVPQIGAAVGDVGFLMAVGYSYESYGPYTLWSYQLALASSICLVSWLLQIIGSLHGDRYKDTQPETN